MAYCRNCGAQLEENAKFCSKCGTSVIAAVVEKREPVRQPRTGMNPFLIAGIVVLALAIVAAVIIVPLLLGGLFPFGGIVGNGNSQTRTVNLEDFNAVSVGNGFTVQITQSNTYSIKITADENLFEYIETTKSDDTLTIRLRPGTTFTISSLRAEISMPDLQRLDFSGGTHGEASGFNLSHDFAADLSGGSSLTMDGEADDLTVVCSGGSSVEFSDFAVNNANVDFSGGSRGTVNVTGRLEGDLSGGSQLSYIGNPTAIDINTSGGSTYSRK